MVLREGNNTVRSALTPRQPNEDGRKTVVQSPLVSKASESLSSSEDNLARRTSLPEPKAKSSAGMLGNKETQQLAREASEGSSIIRPPMNDKGRLPDTTSTEAKDSVQQEQALFEQRLCDDTLGVAVRKINQNGKTSLRYVKCVTIEELDGTLSNRSVSSRSAGSRGGLWSRGTSSAKAFEPGTRVLMWGKKREVKIPLDRFVAVRKGKTTFRAKRNPSPANRILSVLCNDPNNPSLDIEAPTNLDREKFARAFSNFLKVPLEGNEDHGSVTSAELPSPTVSDIQPSTISEEEKWPTAASAGDDSEKPVKTPSTGAVDRDVLGYPPLPPSSMGSGAGRAESSHHSSSHPSSAMNESASNRPSSDGAIVSLVPVNKLESSERKEDEADDVSGVSSLTGHGYDQELVEELHHAVNELRAELDESRAEAARAVKVAEQAIQSAEKSNSQQWQNTVTHKAAEAAAMAQKKSAEALAKQRVAEERLEGERKTALFWRKQAELAEEEAGKLQTRAAAAEVRRSEIEERLESERMQSSAQLEMISKRYAGFEEHQRNALQSALDRSRMLEMELEAARSELASSKRDEGETKQPAGRKKMSFGRKKKHEIKIPLASSSSTKNPVQTRKPEPSLASEEQLRKLQAESDGLRQQFENLREAVNGELSQLPKDCARWSDQMAQALQASQSEVSRLRSKLASESAGRRKLLHEVQDLRGSVRVYCRPRMPSSGGGLLSQSSQDTLMLDRGTQHPDSAGPVCFEFDRIFEAGAGQQDVYGEVEEVCLGALDGYRICTMCYGQSGSGKTYTILGDINIGDDVVALGNHGIQLRAMKQLFKVANERSDRYQDEFMLTILEVYNERLFDLMVGTKAAEDRGEIIRTDKLGKKKNQKSSDHVDDNSGSGKPTRLEIRTDVNGSTVVQGLVSVTVQNFSELCAIWSECLELRAQRLGDMNVDVNEYEASSHCISTIQIQSTNIATGIGTRGRLQFVDLVGADLAKTAASQDSTFAGSGTLLNKGYRFAHKSLETLYDVIDARVQFSRSVPYRNSTLTHLLLDSLEADTKVIFLACVSSDTQDVEETLATLRFASRIRRVNVGKATKHTTGPP